MNILPISLAFVNLVLPAVGQETAPKWDVEIPPPITDAAPTEPAAPPTPIEHVVLSSRTKRVDVKEAPEMPDLPPIEGTINVTIQKVANPGLPDPPPPLPALPVDDPAVIARLAELRENYRGRELAFVSASVHDDKWTLLRIYPNGKLEQAVTAWSNVNLLHFSGYAGYRVKHADGSFEDHSLLMGISPVYSDTARRIAARAGREYEPPEIPNLPDLLVGGPSFVVVEGETDSAAMDTLEQVHDLYRKEGEKMEAAYHAREQARAERKAFLLANPPIPKDVKIRVWRRTPVQTESIQEGGDQ
jgi:hypothetical protein